MDFSKMAVVGSGTMGQGIAQVGAQTGLEVRVLDIAPAALDKARAGIEKSLAKFAEKGKITAEAREAAHGRLVFTSDFEQATDGVDLVVEAIVENEEAKRDLFGRLDQATPDHAILATNTSSISITTIAAATKRPEKVIGMHFMNPVPLMKLVEVIRGHATSDETCADTMALAERMGKTPVEVNDYPGFVSNRVLMPLINEAAFTLMEGVATREAIDTVMKLGMNHPMGPLTLADFIGIDVCVAILDVLYRGLGDPKYRACPLMRRMMAAGHLGRKTGRGFYDYS